MDTGPTIVIGDTSAATARQLAEVFQKQGIEVLATCQDGLSLVEAVLRHRPSLVVLDLILPRLTGLQVIEVLRRKGVAPRYVVASAVSAKARVLEAKAAGASCYILKPFDTPRLDQAAARLATAVDGDAQAG